jgi:hypothetical protein
MVGVVTIAAIALAAGYPLGRLRPWQRLGNWAADQVRHAGTWARGGTGRQTVVVLAHAVTTPRTSRRIMHAPATETRAPVPVRDGFVHFRRQRLSSGSKGSGRSAAARMFMRNDVTAWDDPPPGGTPCVVTQRAVVLRQ